MVVPSYRPQNKKVGLLRFTQEASVLKTMPQNVTTPKILNDGEQSQTASQTKLQNGSLVRARGDKKVYIIKGNYKRWIQDGSIIDMYGQLRWEDIVEIEPTVLNQYIESNVIRFAGDPRVYQVSSIGFKAWIKSEQEFLNLGYNFRSEECRVGKECRSRWSPYHSKKKQ